MPFWLINFTFCQIVCEPGCVCVSPLLPLMGRAMCLDAIARVLPARISRWAIQIALHDFLTLAFNSNYPVVDCVQAAPIVPTGPRIGALSVRICVLSPSCHYACSNLSALTRSILEKRREESDFHTPQPLSSRRSLGVDLHP